MMSKKIFLILFSIATCLLFYQNCATTDVYQRHRGISLKSKLDIQILDEAGRPFLNWKFTPGQEVLVKISASKQQFCERVTYLNKTYESKWSTLVSSLKPVRSSASVPAKHLFKIKVDGAEIQVHEADTKRLFALMEETKLNHRLNVTNCDKMKWSFKEVTIESLVTTAKQSRYLQIVKLRALGGNAAETTIKEEPVEIKANSKDVFCDYAYREYGDNFSMLNLMFATNEIKALSENSTRGLASLSGPDDQVSSSLLITIDRSEKIIVPENSELNLSLNRFIKGVKASSKVRKSCAYSY